MFSRVIPVGTRDRPNPGARTPLCRTVGHQATLIAQWMLIGFIHGVINSDNIPIVGETIDFGPCAFMNELDANKVFSSIDRNGRHAWSKQPGIGLWNLTRLAETLLPLLSSDSDTAIQHRKCDS